MFLRLQAQALTMIEKLGDLGPGDLLIVELVTGKLARSSLALTRSVLGGVGGLL